MKQITVEEWAKIQKEAKRIHKRAMARERFRLALNRFRRQRADLKHKEG